MQPARLLGSSRAGADVWRYGGTALRSLKRNCDHDRGRCVSEKSAARSPRSSQLLPAALCIDSANRVSAGNSPDWPRWRRHGKHRPASPTVNSISPGSGYLTKISLPTRKLTSVSAENPSHAHTVSAIDGDLTVLAWLRRVLPQASWSKCRQVLAARRVTINGVVTIHEGRRLAAGDRIAVRATGQSPPKAARLAIVFVDREVVIVDKPPHIVSTRRPEEHHWPLSKRLLDPSLDELTSLALWEREHGSLTPAALKKLTDLPRLWRVQRLDRETSGLVVFARSARAAKGLIRQFMAHTVERRYRAVVHGCPAVGKIASQLIRDRGDGRRGSAAEGRPGQHAITHVLSVTPLGNVSMIECRLETGRTHQIRIHLSEQGHPICGDDTYGPARGDGDPSAAPRTALHAVRIAFDHPTTNARMAFDSEWPQDLAQWLQRCSG